MVEEERKGFLITDVKSCTEGFNPKWSNTLVCEVQTEQGDRLFLEMTIDVVKNLEQCRSGYRRGSEDLETGSVAVEVQPRHTGRRTRTQWQFRECQPGQPASATLTVRRRRLFSCPDYTAGKSGLALNGSIASRCADTAIALSDVRFRGQSGHGDRAQRRPLSGVKRTWIKRLVMSASDPKRTFDS